jgi:hypothetical protein
MPLKSHHWIAGVAIDRVLDADFMFSGGSNAARQPGLNWDFFAFMQAMMAVTFGISELHSRNTSGVHAARSSAVPNALLTVEYDIRQKPSSKAPM